MNTQHFDRFSHPAFALGIALALAACGGGGGSDVVAVTPTPPVVQPPIGIGTVTLPPAPAPQASTTWKQVFVDASGEALRGGLNSTGQIAFTTVTDTGRRARFFDGTTSRDITGTDPSRAVAVNDAGQVTGHLLRPDGSTWVFRWSPGASNNLALFDLEPGRSMVAEGINRQGQVTGTFFSRNVPSAFRWTPGLPLQGLPPIGMAAIPRGNGLFINASGAVAGVSSTTLDTTHAALWVANQPARDLGTLGGADSRPADLNDEGLVVGQSTTSDNREHAFLWTPAGGMRDLGTLGGSSSIASALNANGVVVGTADTATGQGQAFVWQNGAMRALGTLGGPTSAATTVNEAGTVGGTALASDGSEHAFIWNAAEGMVDLNARAVLQQPAVLRSVVALANDGSVLVNSTAGLMLLRP